MRVIRILAVLAIATTFGLAAGCGDDDDDTAATEATTTEEAAGGGGGDTEVSMTEYAFDPADATVGPGQTITVTNDGELPHNYTIKYGNPVESDNFDPGVSGALGAPEDRGEYDVICTIPGHREKGMKGTLTVK
jgi:plastocyanin